MSIFPLWFSILSNLLIMDSSIGVMRDFVSCFFMMFQFYTPWNYPSNLWFFDVFREHNRETLERNKSSLFDPFQPSVPLLYPLKMSENLRSSIVSRGYKIGILRRNGWNNYKLFMLLFTQFKSSFFQGVTFINCFRIFKWIVKESLLHKVHGVINRPVFAFKYITCKHWELKEP